MTLHHGGYQSLQAEALLAPLKAADPSRPFVIAQLGQSLDGRIATATGASRWINRSAALDHLHRLRAHVDAVIVGAGTVAGDDPELTVRRVPGKNPARVVIDPTARIPKDARCLAANGARKFVVHRTGTSVRGHDAERIGLDHEDGLIAPSAIIAALFERGLRKILIEGGARTISTFIDAGAIDRLHVLVAPLILGSGVPGLSLRPIAALSEAHRPETRVHVLDDGDVVFDCDLRNERGDQLS